MWDWFVGLFGSGTVTLSGATYTFPGVRIALWGGGLVTFAAGFWARHSVLRAEREAGADVTSSDDLPEAGAA